MNLFLIVARVDQGDRGNLVLHQKVKVQCLRGAKAFGRVGVKLQFRIEFITFLLRHAFKGQGVRNLQRILQFDTWLETGSNIP